MDQVAKYCLLLPAETPLFIHVYHAFAEFLPISVRKQVKVQPYLEGPEANDSGLAERIAGSNTYLGMTIIGGVCDPRQAALKDLEIHAAIVKRLGFYVVSRHGHTPFPTFRGNRNIRTIYGHGGQILEANDNEARLTSTAQALAECVKQYLSLSECKIKSKAFGDLYIEDDELAITCNIPLAFALKRLGILDVTSLSEYFPEWSRLFVSGLARRTNLSIHERGLFEEIIFGTQTACRDLRFNKDKRQIGSILRRHMSSQFDPKDLKENAQRYGYESEIPSIDIASETAEELIRSRIIPSNLETTRLGSHLTDSLWSTGDLVKCSLYPVDSRLAMFSSRFEMKKRSPVTSLLRENAAEAARCAGASEFVAPWIETARNRAEEEVETADIAILTALDEELAAVRNNFSRVKPVTLKGEDTAQCYWTKVKALNSGTERQILLASAGISGRIRSALLTLHVLTRWRPRIIVLAGIAAGIRHEDLKGRNPQHGDILLAQYIVDYEGQKVTENRTETNALHVVPEFRFKPFRINEHCLTVAKRVADTDWNKGIKVERPKDPSWNDRGFASIQYIEKESCLLCGDKVVASATFINALLDEQKYAIGLEMESAGVAAAVSAQGETAKLIVVKAISDFATDKANAETARWRPYARAASAAFAFALCKEQSLL
jgi:nucleoside phosphorylase